MKVQLRLLLVCVMVASVLVFSSASAEPPRGNVVGVKGNDSVLVKGVSGGSALLNSSVRFLWETPDGDILRVGEGRVVEAGAALTVKITDGIGKVSVGMIAEVSGESKAPLRTGVEKGKVFSKEEVPVEAVGKKTLDEESARELFAFYEKHRSSNPQGAHEKLVEAAEAGYLPAIFDYGSQLHSKALKTKDIQVRNDAVYYLDWAYKKATKGGAQDKEAKELAANAAFYIAETFGSVESKPEGLQKAAADWYKKALAFPELSESRRKKSQKELCYITEPDYKCWFQ